MHIQYYLIDTEIPTNLSQGKVIPSLFFCPNNERYSDLAEDYKLLVVASNVIPKENDSVIYNFLTDDGKDNWNIGTCIKKDDELYLYIVNGVVRNGNLHNYIPINNGCKTVVATNDKNFSNPLSDEFVREYIKLYNQVK